MASPSPSPSPSPTPILTLDRVSKHFAGHTAVAELSLSVPRGVIYGLLGPNGAGKTTTIRMIMNILEPDGGAVQVFGEPDGGRAPSERIGQRPEERSEERRVGKECRSRWPARQYKRNDSGDQRGWDAKRRGRWTETSRAFG